MDVTSLIFRVLETPLIHNGSDVSDLFLDAALDHLPLRASIPAARGTLQVAPNFPRIDTYTLFFSRTNIEGKGIAGWLLRKFLIPESHFRFQDISASVMNRHGKHLDDQMGEIRHRGHIASRSPY